MPLVDHLVEVLTKETYTEPELAELLDKPKEVLAYWRVTSGDVPPYELIHGVPVYWRHEIIRWVESKTKKREEPKLDLFEEKPKRKMDNREVLFKLLDDHPRTKLKVLCERHGINNKTGYTIYRKWLVARGLTESSHVKPKTVRNNQASWYSEGKNMKDENPQKAERPVYTPEETPVVDESKISSAVVAGVALGAAMTIIAMAVSGAL